MIGLIGEYVLFGVGIGCCLYALWLDYRQNPDNLESVREGRRWR